MEQTFEAGRVAGQTIDGKLSDCPHEERLAPNLRNVWISGFLCSKTGRAYRKRLPKLKALQRWHFGTTACSCKADISNARGGRDRASPVPKPSEVLINLTPTASL